MKLKGMFPSVMPQAETAMDLDYSAEIAGCRTKRLEKAKFASRETIEIR